LHFSNIFIEVQRSLLIPNAHPQLRPASEANDGTPSPQGEGRPSRARC
jgi:hypothetical protein